MKLSVIFNGVDFHTDFDTLPQASKDYLIAYGYRQVLNDARAITKAEKEEFADEAELGAHLTNKMQAKYDRLLAGTITERANAAERMTPEEKIRQDVIMGLLRSWASAQGKTLPKRTGKNADPEALDAMIAKVYEAKKAKIDAEVKFLLGRKLEIGEIDLDI